MWLLPTRQPQMQERYNTTAYQTAWRQPTAKLAPAQFHPARIRIPKPPSGPSLDLSSLTLGAESSRTQDTTPRCYKDPCSLHRDLSYVVWTHVLCSVALRPPVIKDGGGQGLAQERKTKVVLQ